MYWPGMHQQGGCYHPGMFTSLQNTKQHASFCLILRYYSSQTPSAAVQVFPSKDIQKNAVKLEGLCCCFFCSMSQFFMFSRTLFYQPAPVPPSNLQLHKHFVQTQQHKLSKCKVANIRSLGLQGDLDKILAGPHLKEGRKVSFDS